MASERVPAEQGASAYNQVLLDEPGIHTYPGVQSVELSDEVFAKTTISNSSEPWTLRVPAEVAAEVLSGEVGEGDVIFGKGCQGCPEESAVVFVIESVREDPNTGEVVVIVRSASVEDFVYGQWEDTFPLETSVEQDGNEVRQQELTTHQQGLFDWAATGDLKHLAAAYNGVEMNGELFARLTGNMTFHGHIDARAVPSIPIPADPECTYTQTLYRGEGSNAWEPDTESLIYLERCTREIGIQVDSHIKSTFSLLIDRGEAFAVHLNNGILAYLPRAGFSWRTHIGDSPLSIDLQARLIASLNFVDQGGSQTNLIGEFDAHVPVGFLAANGELRQAEMIAQQPSKGSLEHVLRAGGDVSLDFSAGVELEADVVLRRASWGRLGSLTARSRAQTELYYKRSGCVETEGMLQWSSSHSGQPGSYASGGMLPRKLWTDSRYGTRDLGTFIDKECDMNVASSGSKRFDFDPIHCQDQETPSVAIPSIAPFLAQACAVGARGACSSEDPTLECNGSVRHFFKPFFDPSGECALTNNPDQSYTLLWESGDSISVSDIDTSQSTAQLFKQTQNLEVVAGTNYPGAEGLLTATGDETLQFSYVDEVECTQMATYTLGQGEESWRDEEGKFPSGFMPGDQLTTCVMPSGDLEMTCPNGNVIRIPHTIARYGSCLLGGPCSAKEDQERALEFMPYPERNGYQVKGINPDYWKGATPEGIDELVALGVTNVVANLEWDRWEPVANVSEEECAGSLDIYEEGHCFKIQPEVDDAIRRWSSRGVHVIGVLYGTPRWARVGRCGDGIPLEERPEHLQNQPDDAENWGLPEERARFCSPADAFDFARFARVIAKRYDGMSARDDGTPYGRIADFVIHNEVNQSYWFNVGCRDNCDIDAHVGAYAISYNTAYDSITGEQPTARVYVSLDHVFGRELQTMGIDANRPEGGFDVISGEDFLRRFDALAGSRQWRVAFHPYSRDVGSPEFAHTDWPYVTMGNIGVLAGWLAQNFPGKLHAQQILLTESGYIGQLGDQSSLTRQAEAVCDSLVNVLATPNVAAYVYHRMDDKTELRGEENLPLGLANEVHGADNVAVPNSARVKDALCIWGNANMISAYPPKLDCGFERLPYTHLSRYYDAESGKHWASSRLLDPGFTYEASWRLWRERKGNTRMLYECEVNEHSFISTQPQCEGQRPRGPVGYAHVNPEPGAVALVRCRQSSEDHLLLSEAPGDTVECPAGYTREDILGYVFPSEPDYSPPTYPLRPDPNIVSGARGETMCGG